MDSKYTTRRVYLCLGHKKTKKYTSPCDASTTFKFFLQFPLNLITIRSNHTSDFSIPVIEGACHCSSEVSRVDL